MDAAALPADALGAGAHEAANRPAACAAFEAGARNEQTQQQLLQSRSDEAPPCVDLYLGLLHRQAGQLPEAVLSFQRGAQRFPDHLPLRLELAVTLSWQSKLDEALRHYQVALEQAPESRGARLGEARVLAWRGDLAEAYSRYQDLLTADADDVDALNGLALVARERLRVLRARNLYRQVLDLDPDNVEAGEALAVLASAQRWQVELEAGSGEQWGSAAVESVGPVARFGAPGAVRMRLRGNPSSTLLRTQARYGWNSESWSHNRELARVASAATEQVQLRMSLSLSRGWTATLSAHRWGRSTPQVGESHGLDLSRRLGGSASFLAGLRRSRIASSGHSHFAYAGFAWQPTSGHSMVLQTFAGQGAAGSCSQTMALRWQSQLGDRADIQLGGSWGRQGGSSYLTTIAELAWRLGSSRHLNVRYQRHVGSYAQSSASLGLRVALGTGS